MTESLRNDGSPRPRGVTYLGRIPYNEIDEVITFSEKEVDLELGLPRDSFGMPREEQVLSVADLRDLTEIPVDTEGRRGVSVEIGGNSMFVPMIQMLRSLRPVSAISFTDEESGRLMYRVYMPMGSHRQDSKYGQTGYIAVDVPEELLLAITRRERSNAENNYWKDLVYGADWDGKRTLVAMRNSGGIPICPVDNKEGNIYWNDQSRLRVTQLTNEKGKDEIKLTLGDKHILYCNVASLASAVENAVRVYDTYLVLLIRNASIERMDDGNEPTLPQNHYGNIVIAVHEDHALMRHAHALLAEQ